MTSRYQISVNEAALRDYFEANKRTSPKHQTDDFLDVGRIEMILSAAVDEDVYSFETLEEEYRAAKAVVSTVEAFLDGSVSLGALRVALEEFHKLKQK